MALNIRRIVGSPVDVQRQLAQLRQQLSWRSDVVSPRSRQLTEKVFGEPLPPVRAVQRICEDVRRRGLDALLYYTEQFDQTRIDPTSLRVGSDELTAAHAAADPGFLEVIRRVRHNILSFQLGLLHSDAILNFPGSHSLELRYRPIRRVGVCVPGGAAAYPSTVLMTVCPAQAAGVREIAIAMPPGRFGSNNPDLLATCRELGVSEVYRMGGAQAVAALAYGVEGIGAVDMIVGPGNTFVTLAKRFVYGEVAIDMLAGPSEVVVIADESATARHVAADLIAQAEHSPGVSILVTWHRALLDGVQEELAGQLPELSRGQLAQDSLERYGCFVLADNEADAVHIVNELAPEHVHIATREPERLARQIDRAGALFLGHNTPVALGDYVAGPSHVLPTSGTGRFASGLTANHFLRSFSVLSYSKRGLEEMAGDVRLLAMKEGLTAHAASVDMRLERAPEPSGAIAPESS